jgi:4-hydroxybenzoyl-CoA thioesterase
MKHTLRRAGEILAEGREIRIFARRHPDDPKRIQAVPAPESIRTLCG